MQATSEPAAARVARPRPGLLALARARPETIAIVLLTGLALGLRVTSLSRSLFADEAYSLALAQRGFGRMVALFGYEANGMPYPIVLWPVIRILGTGEAVLRLPSVIAGTASVPALWWAVRRLASPAVALIAAGLLAVSAMAVFYSQLARPYAFVMLAGCLAFGALQRALEGSRRAWIGYAVAMAALAYCDVLAAPIVLPAQALLVRRGGRTGFAAWLRSLVLTAALCLPLLVAVVIARGRRDALYWLTKPNRTLVSVAFEEFIGGDSGLTSVRWATIVIGAALLGLSVVLVRRWTARERDTFAVAACWGVLAPLLLLAASFVHPVFWPRYAIVALPGLCMLGALAVWRLWRSPLGRLAGVACLVGIVVAAAVADARQRTRVQEEWRPVGALLRADRSPGQPLILDNVITLPVLGYYDRAFRRGDGDVLVQEWQEAPMPAGVVGLKDPHGYGSVADGPPTAALAEQLARRGRGGLWIIFSEVDKDLQGDPRQAPAVQWVRAHCTVASTETVGVWVLHATRCAG